MVLIGLYQVGKYRTYYGSRLSAWNNYYRFKLASNWQSKLFTVNQGKEIQSKVGSFVQSIKSHYSMRTFPRALYTYIIINQVIFMLHVNMIVIYLINQCGNTRS